MGDFLGTGATFAADLNLVLQVAMGLVLIGGMFLARSGRYTVHKYVQSAVVLANLVLIGTIMVPSYRRQVEPYIPSHLSDPYYWVATIHGIAGIGVEALGLYVILAAGTKLLPERLRLTRFKLWMRTLLILWWAVILLGVGLYYVWYLAPASAGGPANSGATGNHRFTILISNYTFTPKTAVIHAGTKVTWIDRQGVHSVQALGGDFTSGPLLTPGKRYVFTFTKPGTYPYDCGVHGTLMSARIVVKP